MKATSGSPSVAIVGAGLAGLACAGALINGGLTPVLFDKSRGVGGRLATRRADDGLQFDHGAPYVAATDAGFAEVLRQAEAAGAMARWDGPLRAADRGAEAYVGLPGMSGLARHLARGLDIRTGVTVSSVSEAGRGWRLRWGDQEQVFDRVILTLPAPQILRLVHPDHPFVVALAAVRMAPSLTLMAAFDGAAPSSYPTEAADLDWIALDSSKPGRDIRRQAWVAQASDGFSRRHLERDMPEVAHLMLPLLCEQIGRRPDEAVHAVAHRWRFSKAEQPLGQPCLADATNGLIAAGDWCLGKVAQDAGVSGLSAAARVLGG